MRPQRFGHGFPQAHARIEDVVGSRDDGNTPAQPRDHLLREYSKIDRIEDDAAFYKPIHSKDLTRQRAPAGTFFADERQRSAPAEFEIEFGTAARRGLAPR